MLMLDTDSVVVERRLLTGELGTEESRILLHDVRSRFTASTR